MTSDQSVAEHAGMDPAADDDFLFYNFHPPDEVRIFATPRAAVKRWDSSVLVFDARIGDGILRKYSFTDRWFEVHCTFDLNGDLLPERGTIDWAFNCDMCTPALLRDGVLYNVDLSLDVLVEPNGTTYALTDEDDFGRKTAAGLLTPTEVVGARQGADDLIAIIRRTGIIPFLEEILPFDSVLDNRPQGPPEITTPAAVPLFAFSEREKVWPPARLSPGK